MDNLHSFPEYRHDISANAEIRIIMDVDIGEALELLYNKSPLKNSSYERVSNDLVTGLNEINDKLDREPLDGEDFVVEYVLEAVGCDFLAPVLNVDVDEQRKRFCRILNNKYGVENPLDLRFEEERDEESPNLICLEKIVDTVHKEHKQILKHDPSRSLKDRAYYLADKSVSELNEGYSLEKYVLALGLYLLSSALGNNPERGNLDQKFDNAGEGHPKYVLISKARFREEEE